MFHEQESAGKSAHPHCRTHRSFAPCATIHTFASFGIDQVLYASPMCHDVILGTVLLVFESDSSAVVCDLPVTVANREHTKLPAPHRPFSVIPASAHYACNRTKVQLMASNVPILPFPIPGVTPDGMHAQLLNVDGATGLVTTIIHIAPGARIPAHFHNDGSEAHYVLTGDHIEAGVPFGPGAFLTHPAGVVHGPHESRGGCAILTLQTAYVDPAAPDFHIAE